MRRTLERALFSLLLAFPATALAAFDIPGAASFDWLAEDKIVYQSLTDIPANTTFSPGAGEGWFSSEASEFGEEGAYVWIGFPLVVDPGTPDARVTRYGMLLMDLDFSFAPLDGTPLPHTAIRASYIEKEGDTIVFQGEVMAGSLSVLDVFFLDEDDGSGVEGSFSFIFVDPSGTFPGCRVLAHGQFSTRPAPTELRRSHGIESDAPTTDTYVDSGCDGNVVLVDDGEGCDCGGSDESSGCEGDSSDSSGCEGDTSSSGDCGGDSGGGCQGDTGGSADCGGDVGSGGCSGCEGAAHAATLLPRHSGTPLKALIRFFPEATVLLFLAWLRKKTKRSR
jgi:hypothetical protein